MIKDFLIALVNFNKYGKLVKNSGWKVAGYLAILLTLCSIGSAVVPTIRIANVFGTFFKEEIPDFKISNNGLEIAEDFGFELAGIKFFISSGEEVTAQDFGDNVSGALLDKNSVIIRNMGQDAEFSYSEFNTDNEIFSFFKKDLNLLTPFMNIFKISLAIAMALSFVVSYLLNGLFMGLMCMLLAGILKVKKPFGEHLKTAFYAKTLPAVVSAVLNPFGFFLPPFISTIYVLVIMYLYLKSERESQEII